MWRSLILLALIATTPAWAAKKAPWVVDVAEAYLEMRTGPGRGYPVFHAVENSESVTVVKRRTGWYKVRTDRDITGWVSRTELEKTRHSDGRVVDINDMDLRELVEHRWRAGFAGDADVPVIGEIAALLG